MPRPVVRSSASAAAYGQGRICAEGGCTTRLSIYNEDRFCSLHGGCPDCDAQKFQRRRTGSAATRPEVRFSPAEAAERQPGTVPEGDHGAWEGRSARG
jgi:hypothetical protein